jgi:hypothetical protein
VSTLYLILQSLIVTFLSSVPNALQYEKFHIPDALRILDGIVETLLY